MKSMQNNLKYRTIIGLLHCKPVTAGGASSEPTFSKVAHVFVKLAFVVEFSRYNLGHGLLNLGDIVSSKLQHQIIFDQQLWR